MNLGFNKKVKEKCSAHTKVRAYELWDINISGSKKREDLRANEATTAITTWCRGKS